MGCSRKETYTKHNAKKDSKATKEIAKAISNDFSYGMFLIMKNLNDSEIARILYKKETEK